MSNTNALPRQENARAGALTRRRRGTILEEEQMEDAPWPTDHC
jgi:hypothetical protein